MRRIDLIVIHSTDSWPTWTARELRAHFKSMGWSRCGYHYIICHNGVVQVLEPIEVVANGVKGLNAHAIHIAWVGGVQGSAISPSFGNDTRTQWQRDSLLALVRQLHKRFPRARICGHRDLSPDRNGDGKITSDEWVKTCPCFDVEEEIVKLLSKDET